MAQADSVTVSTSDWPLANPWPWMFAGLSFAGLAFVWLRIFDDQFTAGRIGLIVLACLFGGTALAIRLTSNTPAYLTRLSKRWYKPAVLLCGSASLGIILFIATQICLAYNQPNKPFNDVTNLSAFHAIFLCTLVFIGGGPITILFLRMGILGIELKAKHEKALMLLFAAAGLFVCSWALFLGLDRAENWDTMRLFLSVLAMVAFFGSPLVLLPLLWQRVCISFLILFHFGGILTCTMRPPPQPWIITQVFTRLYRPYLQFMYLTNAYHFYAPDPNHSCYLWCRLEYEHEGKLVSHWVKSPKVTPSGEADYPSALQYQRRIGFNDQVALQEIVNMFPLVPDKRGQPMINPLLYWRKFYSDSPPDVVLAKKKAPEPPIRVPFSPVVPINNQYQRPNQYARSLLQSYAHHLSTIPHPDYPDAKFKNVRIYRVIHIIPDVEMLLSSLSPNNPVMFQPFYMGKFGWSDRDPYGKKLDKEQFNILDMPVFDEDGELLRGDPLLYWLIPILPQDNNYHTNLDAVRIYAWVFKHAGDERQWIYEPGSSKLNSY